MADASPAAKAVFQWQCAKAARGSGGASARGSSRGPRPVTVDEWVASLFTPSNPSAAHSQALETIKTVMHSPVMWQIDRHAVIAQGTETTLVLAYRRLAMPAAPVQRRLICVRCPQPMQILSNAPIAALQLEQPCADL